MGTMAAMPPSGGGHGGHEHAPQIQVVGDAPPPHDGMPKDIRNRGGTIRIIASNGEEPDQARSFIDHVPRLSDVIANATDENYRRQQPSQPKPDLVHTNITVNKGIIRTKDVVVWDAGANPLSGPDAPKGLRPAAPAELKFLGSRLKGHMASECIVDITDVDSLTIEAPDYLGLPKRVKPFQSPHLDVSPDMVEILVTNYTPRRLKAVPWGMDFQWLFEREGYPTTDLGGDEFAYFQRFARDYDSTQFDDDSRTFLGGRTFGRPFPYVITYSLLKPLLPLTDLWDRPLCVQGRVGA
jgi:hypothetical protein